MRNKTLLIGLLLTLSGMSFSSVVIAADLVVSWDCSPFKELPNAKDGATRPYKGETDTVESAQGKTIFKRRHDTGSVLVWELVAKGRGYELSGLWTSADSKVQSEFPTISFSNAVLPASGSTKMLGSKTGYRDCEVTLLSKSGQKLSLADVSAAPLAGITARVSQNEKGIAQNRTDIQTNRELIGKNSQAIDVNRQGIERNSKGIETNRENIAQNRSDIQTNRELIGKNAQGIDVNRQGIEKNRSDISRNQEQMMSRTTRVDERYQQRGTGSAESWAIYKSGVPFQQQQFCRILENFREDLAVAQAQRNQIKENMAYRTREQRLTALMPDGNFVNWIVRAVSVKQASDGSASVLFELPCEVVIGSHACGQNAKSFIGTIPENSRLYSELVAISVGDFLGVSGNFNFVDEKAAFQKGRSVASFRAMKSDAHCEAKDISKSGTDFFASAISTLSTLK